MQLVWSHAIAVPSASLGSPSSMISHWDLSCSWNESTSASDDPAVTMSSTCTRKIIDPVGELWQ